MKKRNNRGFTLVELLVVIAIIGILAVVAVPALFKNIEKGKVSDLEADISAIRSAVLSYYSSNSEYPIDGEKSNPKPIKLEKDEVDISKTSREGTLEILEELEGLSYPYGGKYELTKSGGSENEVVKAPDTLYLKITTNDKNSTISENGIKKLAKDLGLNILNETNHATSTGLISKVGANKKQVIILPVIN